MSYSHMFPTDRNSNVLRRSYRLCMMLALFFLAVSAVLLGVAGHKTVGWRQTTATITDIDWRQRQTYSHVNHDVTVNYDFNAETGRLIAGKDTILYAGGLALNIGDEIAILHVPDDPASNITAMGLKSIYAFSMMFAFIALVCSAFAYAMQPGGRPVNFMRGGAINSAHA